MKEYNVMAVELDEKASVIAPDHRDAVATFFQLLYSRGYKAEEVGKCDIVVTEVVK